jgi:hypothetical protein
MQARADAQLAQSPHEGVLSMYSVLSRGLRLALGSLFVLGAAVFVAPDAHAQWTTSDACIYPTDVPELFYGDFSDYDNCESLCKKTADYCKKFVKDGANCWQENSKGMYGIYKSSTCKSIEDDEERKSCNNGTDDAKQAMKGFIEDDKDEALAECNAYEDACIDDCNAIVE